ncbi:SH3-domain-containing protein [Obba rivulosa]|uniref:SH3-domain-containing protein n=1 Tax=Obba rivulosa TaxID=1052685 RepID=A0A8E2AM16_9APHY|nr:SH3-domain-containing protein [Obba rivulosa]
MVFANLAPHEKDAFFALLDEYFASRPELFGNGDNGGSDVGGVSTAGQRAAAASAVHQALSSPSLQNAASSVAGGWRKPSPVSAPASSSPDIGSSVGRVAAAAAVFRNQNQNSNGTPPPPPAPPRPPSTGSSQDAPGHIEAQKLVPQRKFGDVDVSSAKNMFTSLRNSTVNKAATPPPVAPPTPAALPRRGGFAPPPVRRVGSTSDSGTSARSPPPPPPPRPHEPEPEGEWAEALYDYTSEDPGDLELQAGERVLVVERSSDDWWTGEIDGRKGLIPASYVKIL